jgi:hypothetical protein
MPIVTIFSPLPLVGVGIRAILENGSRAEAAKGEPRISGRAYALLAMT